MMPKSSATYCPAVVTQDVARVHVGVEEAVAEHLGEEDLDAGARERLQVDAPARSASIVAARSACRACAPSP
jgi:hypothetical protein